MPPVALSSDMKCFPKGFKSASTGVFLPILVKSSRQILTPIASAIAIICRTAFVEPPRAMTTAIAFSKASFVMISEGLISWFSKFRIALPASLQSDFLSLDTASWLLLPGKLIPKASTADAIVLAVYIPPHEPGPLTEIFST